MYTAHVGGVGLAQAKVVGCEVQPGKLLSFTQQQCEEDEHCSRRDYSKGEKLACSLSLCIFSSPLAHARHVRERRMMNSLNRIRKRRSVN
jgi:hypothetical protein